MNTQLSRSAGFILGRLTYCRPTRIYVGDCVVTLNNDKRDFWSVEEAKSALNFYLRNEYSFIFYLWPDTSLVEFLGRKGMTLNEAEEFRNKVIKEVMDTVEFKA
jgi:hypothetical protein